MAMQTGTGKCAAVANIRRPHGNVLVYSLCLFAHTSEFVYPFTYTGLSADRDFGSGTLYDGVEGCRRFSPEIVRLKREVESFIRGVSLSQDVVKAALVLLSN